MKKRQTKAQRFRQLLPEIEKLQEEYLQEAVVEILNEKYGLEINLNTFKNYLHRYGGNKSEEISVKSKNSEIENFDNNQNFVENQKNNESLDEYLLKAKQNIKRESDILGISNQSLFKKV